MTPAPNPPAPNPPAPNTPAPNTAGAEITDALHETDYGSGDFAARDPEGNLWTFGTYRGEPRPQ